MHHKVPFPKVNRQTLFLSFSLYQFKMFTLNLEGAVNIEYGNIKNGNIEFNLTSNLNVLNHGVRNYLSPMT